MPTVTTSTTLNCPPEELRRYLGTVANLHHTTDPELDLEIVEAPEEVTEDGTIEFRISAYGFKQRMQHRWTRVTDLEIVAEQTDGPTRAWVHQQTIAAQDGGCRLTDQIDFEPPGGMLGFVMTADKIEESIRDGMAHRYDALQELFPPA